jgi:uncharacterized protein DUF6766
MRRLLRDNGLTLTMFGLFLLFLVGQSVAGEHEYNQDQAAHHQPTVGYATYLTTGAFVEATFENWESEFLQMAAYVPLTVFLFQRGSAESKDPDQPDPVDENPGDPRKPRRAMACPQGRASPQALRELPDDCLHLAVFVLLCAPRARRRERVQPRTDGARRSRRFRARLHHDRALLVRVVPELQSEFMAVGAIVVLSIFLRQRGSPQSKPVAAPHGATGSP